MSLKISSLLLTICLLKHAAATLFQDNRPDRRRLFLDNSEDFHRIFPTTTPTPPRSTLPTFHSPGNSRIDDPIITGGSTTQRVPTSERSTLPTFHSPGNGRIDDPIITGGLTTRRVPISERERVGTPERSYTLRP